MPGVMFLCLACFVPCALFPPTAAAGRPIAHTSSLRVVDASSVEHRTNGKVFGFDPGRGAYSCSGTALSTPSRSIVLTAGHCALEEGRLSERIRFVPAYDHGARPFGTFQVSRVYTMAQWRHGENPDFDVAALMVRPSRLGTLGDVVGGREWTTGRSRYSSFEIFGYPAAALRGESLRACDSPGLGSDLLTDPYPGPPTVRARCDMAGGASGGAWIVDGQYVDGVTSYSYLHENTHLFSPYFGAAIGRFLASLP
jgi:hypothetical protein